MPPQPPRPHNRLCTTTDRTHTPARILHKIHLPGETPPNHTQDNNPEMRTVDRNCHHSRSGPLQHTHTQPDTEHARTTSGHDTEDDETNDEDSSSDDSDPDFPDLPHKTLQDRRTQDHIIDIARKTSPSFTITASEMGTVTALDPITKNAMTGFLD